MADRFDDKAAPDNHPDQAVAGYMILRDGRPYLVVQAAPQDVQSLVRDFAARDPGHLWSCVPHEI